MFGESVSAKPLYLRIVALLAVVMFAAACAEQDSTGAAQRPSDKVPSEYLEASKTSANGVTTFATKTIDGLRHSDGCQKKELAPGIHHLSLNLGGWKRNYVVTVPASVDSQSLAHPLLIAMHGFGGSGVGMQDVIGRQSGFEDGYIVLYPDGAGLSNNVRGWNSGHPQCCGTALDNDVDDVAFLRALVDSVAQMTCVDLSRVYATGFSNGGDMAQRLACDASDVVAAVSSVAGRFDYHASACPGRRPVPVVLYRGQLDRVVPYDGALVTLAALKTVPAIEGFEQIARSHKCRGNPDKTLSMSDTDCLRFDDCDAGFEVTLCTSSGAGHCWPGVGSCSRINSDGAAEFSASDHMRDFFNRHSRAP